MLAKEEIKKNFYEFLIKYQYEYFKLENNPEFFWIDDESLMSFLRRNYEDAYYNPQIGDCIFQQIFSGINALDDEKNPYHQMMSRIESEYGLDIDIIDVGCGYFPALSYEISKRREKLGIEKGSVTAFDPNLITSTLDGINLIKGNFTLATPLPKNALLIGRKPCMATETIVRTGNLKNIEFYIQLCDCEDHIPHEYKLIHKNYSMEGYIESIARRTLPNNLKFEKEIVEECVGDSIEQKNKEIVVKTKRMR